MKISPRALSAYTSCPRLAYFRHKMRLKEPPRPGAELGSEVHLLAERWITTGQAPDDSKAGRIAAALVPLLPRLPKQQVETWIDLKHEELDITGRVDYWKAPLGEGDPFEVHDLKTTSDFKWCKNSVELQYDPQSIVYSKWALARSPYCRFTLHYVRMSPPHYTQEVSIEWTRESIVEPWAYLTAIMSAFVATMNLAVEETPFNEASCGNYGGCPHRARCAAMGVRSLGDFSALFQPTGERTMALPPPTRNVSRASIAPSIPKVPEPAPAQNSAIDRFLHNNPLPTDLNPPPVAGPALAPFDPVPATTPEPKKRGRKPKADPAPVPDPTPAPTPAPMLPVITPAQADVILTGDGLTIYVNAIPNDRYVTLDDLVRPLEVEVAANREERRGEHYLTIAYNQGTARVAALLEMRADKILHGIPAVVVFLRHPCAAPCLEILIPRASRVVYGVLG